jgi:predicted RNA binding protein YcfA (HicA-like mRNA interferase family)
VAYKAAKVRRGLEKRFRKVRQRGSHVIFQVGSGTVTFGYHDRVELADRQLRKVAADFGLTLDELKDLV